MLLALEHGSILKILAVVACWGAGLSAAAAAEPFSILDFINQAIKTNPGVAEASANRRATEAELRQSQVVLLPQIRLQSNTGPEMLNHYVTPAPVNNGAYVNGAKRP